jgi:GNAT superfamily N-acetyltransferase
MLYVIRPFTEKDSGGVKDLILAILTKEYPFDKSAYSSTDLDKVAEVYGGKNDSFFVSEEADSIVGTVGVKEDTSQTALLRRLFVSAEHRRKGIGSKLLDTALDFCRSRGYKKIIFRCTDRMSDAMRLCLKRGFKETEAIDMGGFKIHMLVLALSS